MRCQPIAHAGHHAAPRARAWRVLPLLCLIGAPGTVPAQEIYRFIDASGHVVYSDRPDPAAPQAAAVPVEAPGNPPRKLHFCWTNCFTLTLADGVYRRDDGTDESWTVESFAAQGIVLHRHDAPAEWNGYRQDVTYAGRMSNDRLVDVTVDGKPVSGIALSWGTALDVLPGSNAERDAVNAAEPYASPIDPVSSDVAPPAPPAEDQPPLPEDGYLWTPGYWYWRNRGYVWIPGVWLRPPRTGFLWTPGYWSVAGTGFLFHPGHWGATVGYYGGVNYGHGYSGSGYSGGRWVGSSFNYDSALNRVSPALAQHTGAGPASGRAARGVVSIAPPSSGFVAPQQKALPRAAGRPAAAVTPRTSEPQPRAAAPESPPAPARPVISAPRTKINEVARTGTVPSKK